MKKIALFVSAWLLSTLACGVTISDDFTQGAVNDSPGSTNGNTMNWATIAPACLTAGSSTNNSTTVANTASNYSNIPACNLNSSTTGISTPDAAGSGALRLTNTLGNQAGAIISQGTYPSNQGIKVTFTTYTYGGSGADGIGFFLQDASVPVSLPYVGGNSSTITTGTSNIGESGGSLGYTCSNYKSSNYNGLTGAYIGLGMDEYGNFTNPSDNTASGPGAISNTISLRGAGNVSWYWLSTHYPNQYPTSSSSGDQLTMVEKTCSTGLLQSGTSGNLTYSTTALSWSSNVLTVTLNATAPVMAVGDTVNISASGSAPTVNGKSIVGSYVVTAVSGSTFSVSFSGGSTSYSHVGNGQVTVSTMDYPSVAGSVATLPNNIGSSASSRSSATPITYKLSISPSGLLNFMYSYNGGAYQQVLTNTSITSSNGPVPANYRFGFLGSTGGATNIHEITCFIAEPTESSSGAGANTVQAGQVKTGNQIYTASYNPNYWTGSVTSQAIVQSAGVYSISSTATWDGSCMLTGGSCSSTGVSVSSAQAPSSRTLLSWNPSTSAGIALQWASLSSAQQGILNSTDSLGTTRLDWLRGGRSNEQTSSSGTLRARASVLGDVVDSSPTWVGPPAINYGTSLVDALYSTTGSESSYASFSSNLAQRLNMVYVGSNDGLFHGFRTGAANTDGSYNSTLNDGAEVIGFMPASVLSNSNVVSLASPTYGHNYFADAAPGYGDVYYNGAWHTWLVSGLGPGGQEIFVLDITDPQGNASGTTAFAESSAATLVKGDWTASSLSSCVHATSNCGNNLGYTYGTPLIRRLHNGQWAIIFGNGYGSSNKHAGVFIGLIDSSSGAVSFTWLDTGSGSSSSPNGIAYVSSIDLDGDHITDYLYAGDLLGQVWRFDLTSSNATDWAVSKFGRSSATPLFTALSPTTSTTYPNGIPQPITTQIAPTVVSLTNAGKLVVLGFGTGQATPFTNSAAEAYAGGSQTVTQTMYGIWDWDMNAWNNGATSAAGVTIPPSASPMTSLAEVTSSPYRSFSRSNLQSNSVTSSSTSTTRYQTTSTVCWQGSAGTCTTQYGWYFDLPGTNEQLIYSPVFQGGALIFNTTIPPAAATTGQCVPSLPTGWSMLLNMTSGGGFPQNALPDGTGSFVVPSAGASITGSKQNAVGKPYIVTINNQMYSVNQTIGGTPTITKINTQGGITAKRISWEQIR